MEDKGRELAASNGRIKFWKKTSRKDRNQKMLHTYFQCNPASAQPSRLVTAAALVGPLGLRGVFVSVSSFLSPGAPREALPATLDPEPLDRCYCSCCCQCYRFRCFIFFLVDADGGESRPTLVGSRTDNLARSELVKAISDRNECSHYHPVVGTSWVTFKDVVV